MRPFDVSPLFRTTVGFDRLLDLAEEAARPEWPPYNIEKLGDTAYRITLALPGFGLADIDLTQDGTTLTVAGRRAAEPDDGHLLHRGITTRPFRQTFSLADHVRVAAATLDDGLLAIDLVRDVPEQAKPRRIAIGAGAGTSTQDGGPERIAERPAPRAA